MKTFLIHILEKIRGSAWTIPAVLSLLYIFLAQSTLLIDEQYQIKFHRWIEWLEITSPEGGRALLSTIATSMLAITGVSFSSMVVVLTLASQQFGPRLLRNFIADKFSQTVLGALIGTFIYCLLILSGIRATESDHHIPQLSITTAVLSALLCLALFIKFIHHIASEIQAERVVKDSFCLLENAIDEIFPSKERENVERHLKDREFEGWEISAEKIGYVQAINIDKLVDIAAEHDAVFVCTCRAGHFLSSGSSIVKVTANSSVNNNNTELIADIRKSFLLGEIRTPEQDYEFGIRQLVEVAMRALSPGINDPFTAMNCIDYIGAALQKAFSRSLPKSIHRDEKDNIRLYSWVNSYDDLVEASLNQIRQAGKTHCDVSCRLLEMLAETAKQSDNAHQHELLLFHAKLVLEDSLPNMHNNHDSSSLKSRFREVEKACNA